MPLNMGYPSVSLPPCYPVYSIFLVQKMGFLDLNKVTVPMAQAGSASFSIKTM